MGSGLFGSFGNSKGNTLSSVDANVDAMIANYPINEAGFFGERGKNERVIKTPTPEATSMDFYGKIGIGGTVESLTNGKGTRTILDDGTIIVHRLITKTPNSPAVSIKVINSKRIKSQKIHFIKEGE